ncbi:MULTISPECIES: glutamate 5-kinase [unclassified Mesorhizobium]|uniref:glutamate 5-kinase n=1 Tax=unclassified Mesorhizobium TaxID=325217 RepID=UPI001FE226C6|nr:MULTISPECIES: glutamate 5-kinase [unclassified Mesorhizobium]
MLGHTKKLKADHPARPHSRLFGYQEIEKMFSLPWQQHPIQKTTSAGQLLSARRIIVKIGSALLVDPQTRKLRGAWLESLIADVARFFSRGQQVILVTSGAVALGSCQFDGLDRPLRIEEKQTAAAIGQVRLMLAYEQRLKRHGFASGQMLLTSQDIENQNRRHNAWSTLQQLLKIGAVPIINENDTTATAEICFGDNDRLAARVAQMVNADLLILLSNVDGLFTEDPHDNPLARLVTEVRCITPEIEAMAGHSLTRYSSGGMVTKLMAAKIAMGAGCGMVIARGTEPYPLAAIENGSPSTSFVPIAKDKAIRGDL